MKSGTKGNFSILKTFLNLHIFIASTSYEYFEYASYNTHTKGYYSAIKRDQLLLHLPVRRNLKTKADTIEYICHDCTYTKFQNGQNC